MKKDNMTNDYERIILDNIPLIDVRAPIEYEKGAFINSVNMPILTNDERHIIGICYKENGNEEATKLGYSIVSGDIKEERVNNWKNFIKENPSAMIYCFRGGSRSTIAQKWINENIELNIVKLQDGYKGFRNYLIDALEPGNIKAKPLVLSGYTGAGKTILLNDIDNSIDLEGIANHRGSTFGHHVTPQPTQINFENNLAYEIIKHKSKGYSYIVFEDEGKNIGRSFIPSPFYNFMHNGDLIFLEESLEQRILNILDDYVINGQKEFENEKDDFEITMNLWKNDMIKSMERVKGKMGGDRLNMVIELFKEACDNQLITNTYDSHKNWIQLFLSDYYDPMYKHSISKSNRKILFSGNRYEVKEFLTELEK